MPAQKKTDTVNTKSQSTKAGPETPRKPGRPAKTKQTTKAVSKDSQSQSLVIKGQKGRKLSPGQLKFNRLIKQIEQLQQNMESQTRTLDAMQNYYLKEVVPHLPKENEIQINYIKALFTFYKRKRKELSQEEHEYLGQLLEDEYEAAEMEGIETDPELQAIHKKIYHQSYEDSLAGDLELFKTDALDYLFMHGVDVEDDVFDQAASFEAVKEKVKSIIAASEKKPSDAQQEPSDRYSFQEAKSQQQNTPHQKHSKKTEAQLKKEQREKEKEALKQKSVNTIYKQLAKLFHPDLEPDEEKKGEKEALMKQLTRAYQQKDLHTLLQLELEWIQKEENNLQQLADDKLTLYAEILREQVRELIVQAQTLKWHPQYSQMLDFADTWIPSLAGIKASLRALKAKVDRRQLQITKLKKNDARSISLLKDIIRDYMLERAYMDDDFDDDFDDDDDYDGPFYSEDDSTSDQDDELLF